MGSGQTSKKSKKKPLSDSESESESEQETKKPPKKSKSSKKSASSEPKPDKKKSNKSTIKEPEPNPTLKKSKTSSSKNQDIENQNGGSRHKSMALPNNSQNTDLSIRSASSSSSSSSSVVSESDQQESSQQESSQKESSLVESKSKPKNNKPSIIAAIAFVSVIVIVGITLGILLPIKAKQKALVLEEEETLRNAIKPPPPVYFTEDGNRCARGFELTMKNKVDLYNFSQMGYVEESSLQNDQCERLCAQNQGCSFYEYTDAFEEIESLCKYVTDWPYDQEKVKPIFDEVADISSDCYIRVI